MGVQAPGVDTDGHACPGNHHKNEMCLDDTRPRHSMQSNKMTRKGNVVYQNDLFLSSASKLWWDDLQVTSLGVGCGLAERQYLEHIGGPGIQFRIILITVLWKLLLVALAVAAITFLFSSVVDTTVSAFLWNSVVP